MRNPRKQENQLIINGNSKNSGSEPSFLPKEGESLNEAPLSAGDIAKLPNGATAKVASVLCCGEGDNSEVRYYFGGSTPRGRLFLYGYELRKAKRPSKERGWGNVRLTA